MKLTNFKGIAPRTSPRLLGDLVAQVASNVNLSSGEARPLAQPALVYTPLKTGPLRSLYKADDYWFTWPHDTDVVRSPIPGAPKWVYTGDGEPRITTAALATTGFGDNYPALARTLGVPKPLTAPAVVPTGGSLVDVDRYYVYSFYDDWNQESAFSPVSARVTGKPDATQWAITGMDATPPNSGDITALTYTGSTVVITTTNKHYNRAGDQITLAGISTVRIPVLGGAWGANALNGTWTLTAVDTTAKTMTFVASEEPEGPSTNIVTYSEDFTGASWLETGLTPAHTAVTAPDGVGTFDLLQESATNSAQNTVQGGHVYTAGQRHVASVYAQRAPGAVRYLGLSFGSVAFGTNVNVVFDLAGEGTYSVVLPGTDTTAGIEKLPDGTYRCWIGARAAASGSANKFFIRISNVETLAAPTYTGDGTSGLYVWGAQQEVRESGTPSSYIKTVAAAVARTGTYDNVVDTADTWSRVSTFGTCTKRLYRTTGSAGQFQLVADGITGTTYNDSLLDLDIPGDEAISTTWEMPPTDLASLFSLPSGALAGVSGNEICFSEPFQPHAWPPEYRMRVEDPCVAAAVYRSGIVVGTTGTPGMIIGHEPGQMAAVPVTGAYPCLSKRSMVSLGDSVGYATAHGFAQIGDTGPGLMTQDTFTRDDWDNYDPTTMVAATVRGRLYLMTQGLGATLLIYDFLDGTGLTTSDIDATELYADTTTGKLYISDQINQDVREFDPNDGVYMVQDWMSKEFVLPEPVNLGAARVNFAPRWSQAQYDALLNAYLAALAANAALVASGDVGGELGGDEFGLLAIADSTIAEVTPPDLESTSVVFTLYVDNEPVYSRTVTDTKGFRLPSGFLRDTIAVRVQGQSLVKSIDIAATMIGLKGD